MLEDDISLIIDIAVINGHNPRLDSHYKYGEFIMCKTCAVWIYFDASIFPSSTVSYTSPCGQIP